MSLTATLVYRRTALYLGGPHFFPGMPLLFLVPWVMAKYWYENHM